MAGNSFGTLFRLTTFGESHGPAMGGVLDGCPSGLELDLESIQRELDSRKPGQSDLSTKRSEEDRVEILSGVFEGKTTGTTIGFIIRNKDARSQDYSQIKKAYRPSHADYTWDKKFGFRDYRGGGRASARETVCRVVGGAIALQLLSKLGVEVNSAVTSVGRVDVNPEAIEDWGNINNPVRCPDDEVAKLMIKEIEMARDAGDSIGGVISANVTGVPAGWGEPVFDKLNAELGKALFSINAVKGVEFGSGFESARKKGSELNDLFVSDDSGEISTSTNNSGGIQGGISNGEDIFMRVAFKPVASIYKTQQTVDQQGNETELEGKGRHDPCVVPRAVPIVKAMIALVLADHYLLSRANKMNE